MIEQFIQITGSVLILAAFVASLRGWLNTKSRVYLILNLLGSAILAVDAAISFQLGFLLLEGVWAIVSAISLVNVLRSGKAGTVGH